MAIPERGEISKFLVQKKKNKTGKSGNTALNFSLANLFLAFAFFLAAFWSLERRRILNIVWDSVARRSLKKSRALLK